MSVISNGKIITQQVYYNSQHALERLALFQAKSRAYGMPAFIRNIRRHLCRPALPETAVPARLVRDIALPPFARPRPPRRHAAEESAPFDRREMTATKNTP